MKKIIEKLNTEQRVIFYTTLVNISVFVILSPLFFFNHYDIPLGWLVGSIGGIVAFLILVRQMDAISTKVSARNAVGYFYSRFVVYLVVLALPLILNYFEINILNVYLVFLGLLTHKVVIFTKRIG